MRKVVFGINITADGYCGHTEGIADEELHSYYADFLRTMDIMLLGRITYQLMVPYWPDAEKNPSGSPGTNDFARVFNRMEKIVCSTTLTQADGNNTRIIRANVAEEVRHLKRQQGKAIGVGGLSLVSQLSAHGLIDEYRFVVHPVIAGKGPRLFASISPQETLMLEFVESHQFQSGVIALHYKKKE